MCRVCLSLMMMMMITLLHMQAGPHEGFVYQTRIKANGQIWVRCLQTVLYPLEISAVCPHFPEDTNNTEINYEFRFIIRQIIKNLNYFKFSLWKYPQQRISVITCTVFTCKIQTIMSIRTDNNLFENNPFVKMSKNCVYRRALETEVCCVPVNLKDVQSIFFFLKLLVSVITFDQNLMTLLTQGITTSPGYWVYIFFLYILYIYIFLFFFRIFWLVLSLVKNYWPTKIFL